MLFRTLSMKSLKCKEIIDVGLKFPFVSITYQQQLKAYATRMHAPAAPASAAPQPTSRGPAQRHSVSLTAAETTGPTEVDHLQAQCFTGTPAVETTGQAEHACNTPSSEHGNNSRPTRLGCTPLQPLYLQRQTTQRGPAQ
jgi:hypothetical protein